MRERQEIHDLRIIGGGAKSKLWKQIPGRRVQCDVSRRLHLLRQRDEPRRGRGRGRGDRAVPGSAGGLQPYPHEWRHRAGPCRAAGLRAHQKALRHALPQPQRGVPHQSINKKAPLCKGELSAVRLTEGLFPRRSGPKAPFQGSCLRSRLRGCCKFATTSPSLVRRATSPGRGGL